MTEYTKLLRSKKLWPINPKDEQNWSGRGQHAEFQKEERKLVDDILKVEDLLGSTNIAVVQSVRCKRILLARKTVKCNRSMTRDKAIDEAAHLTRLSHAHVVRVIGTYIIGQEFSILLYPVAQWDLETFLHNEIQSNRDPFYLRRRWSPQNFIVCLSNALAYIHQGMTKHMDIKPRNILVKEHLRGLWDPDDILQYRVYIADFGIARSYTSIEATETEGPTLFTRKYAAPEVVDREKRGLPADVFSMGCVFAEIVAAIGERAPRGNFLQSSLWSKEAGKSAEIQDLPLLHRILESHVYGDSSYQANLHGVSEFLDALRSIIVESRQFFYNMEETPFSPMGGDLIPLDEYIDVIKEMILIDPTKRPSAADLVQIWGTNDCCTLGPEPLTGSYPGYWDNRYHDAERPRHASRPLS